jgi:hypothetical protein
VAAPDDSLAGVLVDGDYVGLKSNPEYGINLSMKGIRALEQFRFDVAVPGLLHAP